MVDPKLFTLEGKGLRLTTAEEIAPYLEELKSNDAVEEVRFNGNTLGKEACEALAAVLKMKKGLRNVHFGDLFTTRSLSEIPESIDFLLQAVVGMEHLHTINVNDNAFGLNTVAPLVKFLSQHTPLEHLYLNNNGLGPQAGTLVANALVENAAKKKEVGAKPLRTVICGRNRLETGSMEAWAKAYAAHNQVTHIRMVQNGIRPEGITELITNGLIHLRELVVLDLQDNTFTEMGGKALARAVQRWSGLKELAIGDSLLSAKGGVWLGRALAKGGNKDIEILRLGFNDISAKGVEALAGALDKLPVLRRVELNGNKFQEDDENVEKIRDTLDAYREKNEPPKDEDEDEQNPEWGLDELDELESEDEDEEEAEVEEDEEEELRERILKDADEAEAANVAQKDDKEVDKLADLLSKTEVK